jgi:hypothetical protein
MRIVLGIITTGKDLAMLDSLIVLALIASLVLLPLGWRTWIDRQKEKALRLQARLQWMADQRLGGESYLVVAVKPALTGRGGRVLLSAPGRWRGLVDEVWKDVRGAMPAGYDLVVPGDGGQRVTPQRVLLGKPA